MRPRPIKVTERFTSMSVDLLTLCHAVNIISMDVVLTKEVRNECMSKVRENLAGIFSCLALCIYYGLHNFRFPQNNNDTIHRVLCRYSRTINAF